MLVGETVADAHPLLAETPALAEHETKTWYYAVAQGYRPGIYHSWYGPGNAKEQAAGPAAAKYRKFADRDCALVFSHDNQAQLDDDLAAEVVAAVAALPPPPSGRDRDGQPKILLIVGGCACGNGKGEVRGGWGGVFRSGSHCKECAGGLLNTTNQRAELLAVGTMLDILPHPSRLWIQTDSMTVVNGFRAGQHQQPTPGVGNQDLWARVAAAAVRHTIGEVVYRSDAHRDVWRCHELSKAASQSDQLELDQQ